MKGSASGVRGAQELEALPLGEADGVMPGEAFSWPGDPEGSLCSTGPQVARLSPWLPVLLLFAVSLVLQPDSVSGLWLCWPTAGAVSVGLGLA